MVARVARGTPALARAIAAGAEGAGSPSGPCRPPHGWGPPPRPGAPGDPDSALFLKLFVCYSLRIKVCGSGSPPGELASWDPLPARGGGSPHPRPNVSPPQQAASPVGVALFINRHEHTAGTELVLSKNSYHRGEERGQAGAKRGGEGGPSKEGLWGGGKSPPPAPCWGGGGTPQAAASPRSGHFIAIFIYYYYYYYYSSFFFFLLTRAKYWGAPRGGGGMKRTRTLSHSWAGDASVCVPHLPKGC